jgi:hypothetical protein
MPKTEAEKMRQAGFQGTSEKIQKMLSLPANVKRHNFTIALEISS